MPTPVITGISRASGSAAGGDTVTITGTGLTGATNVSFGPTSAAMTSGTDIQITATSPPGTGTVDITVTTPAGTSTASPVDHFTYAAPVTEAPDEENNQRQSGNIMNIVAVVYGVALTASLIQRPRILLNPVSAPNIAPGLALLTAGLLASYSFFSYVLAIGANKPYDVTWTDSSSKWYSIIRFAADLILASLYVHLLFAAVNIEAGLNAHPKPAGFVFAFFLVFVGAAVVQLARYCRVSFIKLIAALVTFWFWFWLRTRVETRHADIALEVGLLICALIYCGLTYWRSYHDWKTKPKHWYVW